MCIYLLALCVAGTYLNVTGNECLDCPVGTYQNEAGSTNCTACPFGKTTFGDGANDSALCQGESKTWLIIIGLKSKEQTVLLCFTVGSPSQHAPHKQCLITTKLTKHCLNVHYLLINWLAVKATNCAQETWPIFFFFHFDSVWNMFSTNEFFCVTKMTKIDLKADLFGRFFLVW